MDLVENRRAEALERMATRRACHENRMLDLLQDGIEHTETVTDMSVEGFLERLNAEEDAPE